MRLAVLLATLLASAVLLVPAPSAIAQQDGGGAFGPLPPAAPTPAPTVDAPSADDDDVGRITLYIIGAALLVSFAGLALWITRDARRAIPAGAQTAPEVLQERDERRQKMERRAKEQARKRQRAARASRKRNR
jgi:hypothetical protein